MRAKRAFPLDEYAGGIPTGTPEAYRRTCELIDELSELPAIDADRFREDADRHVDQSVERKPGLSKAQIEIKPGFDEIPEGFEPPTDG
jgi:hypothetical protein